MTDDELNDKIEPYLRHMPVVITMGWMEEMMRAFYRDHLLGETEKHAAIAEATGSAAS